MINESEGERDVVEALWLELWYTSRQDLEQEIYEHPSLLERHY